MADLGDIWQSGGAGGLTCGHWATEAEAEEYLAAFLNRTALFRVHRQVAGRPMFQRHFQEPKGVRADLVLEPGPRLVAEGWTGGALVIEVKRSGQKTGPGYSQLLDYMGTAWSLDGGVCVVANFGFLFPVEKQQGPLASIMAQQHIGTASVDGGRLTFYAGESRVLTVRETGEARLGCTNIGHGLGAR